MQKKSYIRKIILLISALLIILLAGYFFLFYPSDTIEVFIVKEQPYSEKVIAVGQLKPKQETILVAEANGKIKSFAGQEGGTISSGTVLIEIENQIRSEYDTARTEYNRLGSLVTTAQTDYSNAQALYEAGAISQMELVSKQNALESALSQQKAAKLQVEISANNAGKYRVTVPYDATLLKAYVAPGDYVTIGQPLAELAGSTGFEVVAELDEKYFSMVREGTPVLISVDNNDSEQIRSEIDNITPKINQDTGMFQVRIKVPEQFPYQASNLTVNLAFLLLEENSAIVISEKYLLPEENSTSKEGFVLINNNGTVKKQAIQTVPGFGGNLLVTAGLKSGDMLLSPEDGLKEGDSVNHYEEGESD